MFIDSPICLSIGVEVGGSILPHVVTNGLVLAASGENGEILNNFTLILHDKVFKTGLYDW